MKGTYQTQQRKILLSFLNTVSDRQLTIEEILEELNSKGETVPQSSVYRLMKKLVEEGVGAKIGNINEECQEKLQESIEKIINESSGGVICFII